MTKHNQKIGVVTQVEVCTFPIPQPQNLSHEHKQQVARVRGQEGGEGVKEKGDTYRQENEQGGQGKTDEEEGSRMMRRTLHKCGW